MHFSHSGDFTNAMNIHPVEAKINSVNLATGDEIGIFDGNNCVGVILVKSELGGLNDTKISHGAVGADDAETTIKDGFVEGNSISYKFWDASAKQEISNIEATYYTNKLEEITTDPRFKIGETEFVSLTVSINTKPVADAGSDQTINENGEGNLSASGSYDAEGQTLSYLWNDIDNLGLSSTNLKEPTFIAPNVSADKNFRIALTVNDGEIDSAPDTVIVTVKNNALPPVADAGQNLKLFEGDYGELDGSNSSDPEGLKLSYFWKIIPNDDFAPDSPYSAVSGFTAPSVAADSKYRAVLTITNSSSLSDRDTVEIQVVNVPLAPIADAGSDFSVNENSNSQLDGSNSYDPEDKEITYEWEDLDGIGLNDLDAIMPEFTAPEVVEDADFRLALTVSNNEKKSDPDTVVVTVKHVNKKPVADAGSNKNAQPGDQVVLYGEDSNDPDGDEISCTWYAPDGISLSNSTSENSEFIAPEIENEQEFEFMLVVEDEWGLKDTSYVTVTVATNEPPVIVTNLNVEVNERESITLDASSTYDPDGDELVFVWSAFLSNEEDLVSIDGENTQKPTILIPEVKEDRIVKLELKVSDGKDRETVIIDVFVNNINRAPVANAGKDLEVEEGSTFVLDGSASLDQDGDTLVYNWNIADFLNYESGNKTLLYTAPLVEQDTVIPVVLVVNDGQINSGPDTMFITVVHINQSPEFASVPEIAAEIGYPLSAEISVDDPDKFDELEVYSTELPDWLKLTDLGGGVAILSADSVPKLESLLGNHTFTLYVTDGIEVIETTVNLLLSIKTSLKKLNQTKIKVYPNPTNDFVNIDFGNLPQAKTFVELFNLAGQTIVTEQADSKIERLDLSSKPKGVYYVRIKSGDNIHTKKIILK